MRRKSLKNLQGAITINLYIALHSGKINISSEEGFAVKKHSENGQVKILSNDKLFDLLKAANLEVPDTMDTEAGADMEQTNETVHLKIVNLPSFYRIIISTPSIDWSILISGISRSAQSGGEII